MCIHSGGACVYIRPNYSALLRVHCTDHASPHFPHLLSHNLVPDISHRGVLHPLQLVLPSKDFMSCR